jgi:hypothetical protein
MKTANTPWLFQAGLLTAVVSAMCLVASPQMAAPQTAAPSGPARTLPTSRHVSAPPATAATATRRAAVPVVGPRVEVIPLKHADAVTAARIIKQVMIQDPVTIEADARTNSLIMIGIQGQIQTVRQLAARLDVPVASATSFPATNSRPASMAAP